MPEVPICVECKKPIRKDTEDYVVTNKELHPYDAREWQYAHADCYKPALESGAA